MNQQKKEYYEKKYAAKLKPGDKEMAGMGPMRRPGPGPRGGRGMAMGKPKNMKRTIGRLISYISHEKLKLFIVFLCVIGGTVSNLAGSYMLRPIINGLTSENGSVGSLLRGILTMLCIYLIAVLAQYLQQRIMINVSQNAIQKLRNDLFDRLQRLPVRFLIGQASAQHRERHAVARLHPLDLAEFAVIEPQRRLPRLATPQKRGTTLQVGIWMPTVMATDSKSPLLCRKKTLPTTQSG